MSAVPSINASAPRLARKAGEPGRVLWLVPQAHPVIMSELHALRVRSQVDVCISEDQMSCASGAAMHPSGSWRTRPWNLLRRGRQAIALARTCGVPWSKAEISGMLWATGHGARIERVIEAGGAEVVHSHFSWPTGTAGWMGARELPLVISLRGCDVLEQPEFGYGATRDPSYRRRLAVALSRASAVTVASTGLLQRALECGADPNRVQMIPNGVDLSRFSFDPDGGSQWRARLGAIDHPMVVAASNLIPLKRVDVAIEAVSMARRRLPDLILAIAGDGPERARLEALASGLGLKSAIRFVGRVGHGEMPALLSAADAFLHMSASEGVGNVVLEAMACGRPCISTATGMAADIMPANDCGVLLSQSHPAAVAEAVQHVLEHPSKAVAMGNRAAALIRARYSMDKRIEGFLATYRRCSAAKMRL